MSIFTIFSRKTFFLFLLYVACICLYNSCNWDLSDPITWNVDILAPIAQSTVTLEDAVADTTLVQTDSLNRIVLIYRDTLANLVLDDLLVIPDTTFSQRFDLETFELNNQRFSQNVSLAFIARTLSNQGNIIGDIILINHGGILPTLPATQGLTSGSIPIDASNLFEFADLTQGDLQMTITNELPVDINNVSFQLRNQQNGEIVVEDFFAELLIGARITREYDLSGQTIGSNLIAELINLDVPEANLVRIDTADFIGIDFEIDNLKASEATAIFPSQTIDSALIPFEYQLTGDFESVQITQARIASGEIVGRVRSTFEDSIGFEYELISAQRNGEIPSITGILEPASPGSEFIFSETRDLQGFELDFTAQGTSFNTLLQYYKVDLIFSGKLVTINEQDSVALDVDLISVKPSYIEGYLGTGTFDFQANQLINSLRNIRINQLDLSEPKARLIFENSLGVDLQSRVNTLRVRNDQKPNFINLSSTLFAQPLEIEGPQLPDTNSVVRTVYTFDTGNSNIRELLNELPNEIDYDLSVAYNVNTIPFNPVNFATQNSKLLGIVEFELPLIGSVEGLRLTDTTALDFSTTEDTASINRGTLRVQFENQFPFEVIVNAAIVDENFQVVEILSRDGIVEAGKPDQAGYVSEATSSEIAQTFSKSQINNILVRGAHLVFQYEINSQPQDTPVTLFSDYQVIARLVGDINYQAQP